MNSWYAHAGKLGEKVLLQTFFAFCFRRVKFDRRKRTPRKKKKQANAEGGTRDAERAVCFPAFFSVRAKVVSVCCLFSAFRISFLPFPFRITGSERGRPGLTRFVPFSLINFFTTSTLSFCHFWVKSTEWTTLRAPS